MIATNVEPVKAELSLVESKLRTVADDVYRETAGYVTNDVYEALVRQRRNELTNQTWELESQLNDLRRQDPACVF